jgi:ATP-dependent protease ClpP protease subunit|tara:strand:+ start:2210 stop:2842 length:633 start_codon:yes stop_codon:yes gene_type:complete
MKKAKQIDIMDLLKPPVNQNSRIISKNAVNIHEFYLSGDIESSEDYIDWFDIIRSASPNDILKFYINSSGGDLFTAIQFLRVLSDTDATISVSVEGACMSAATLIFLCGHQFEVSPHSMFMFHNYSSGVMGKGGEMYDRLSHEKEWSEKLLRDVYVDFLTEKEITSILDNKDIWMDGEQCVKRLQKKVKAMEKKAAKRAKSKEEDDEDDD